MKCKLCHKKLDADTPFTLYERNPETFRFAWMHQDCFTTALEELSVQPSNYPWLYTDKQDEYFSRFR